MGGDSSDSAPSSEDTSRRRLLTLMGAGGAAALATLVSSKEAQAGHDGSNVMHLGEGNSAPGSSTIDANVDGPMLLLNNSHSSGNALHAHKPVGVFVVVERPALMVENQGAGGGAIEGASKAGGIGVEGFVVPADEELEFEFEDQRNGYGVRGISSSSPETYGDGPGVGVHGQSGSGNGVLGTTTGSGAGVRAASWGDDGIDLSLGPALWVEGRSRFSTAGGDVVPAGQTSVFVANEAVTADSHISVTLVSDPGSRSVRWIERDPGNGFTVHMSSAPPPQRLEILLTYFVVEPG
jgi:hypothetical protein